MSISRKKYFPYLLIGFALLLFALAELLIPKPLDWNITLSAEDKNPYGAYGLSKVLPSLFQEREIRHLHSTIYETDSLSGNWNYLILSENFAPDKEDTRVLLEKASHGASVFIAASHFDGPFTDSLKVSTQNLLFEKMEEEGLGYEDSVHISLTHPAVSNIEFAYTLPALATYFELIPEKAIVLARNHEEKPVFFSRKWGKGTLYISSTPLAFSNYYLLEGHNYQFIQVSLSYLPVAPLLWTEYYQLGRMEAATPLRFILGQPALRWAYYIGILALLLFILFGIKRKQRPIPTIQPPENTSLQFANSIGTLYFQQGDHLNLARKKIVFLNEHIRTHYRILPDWQDESFPVQLAQKSNRPEEEIKKLQDQIREAEKGSSYSSEQLLRLHKTIVSWHKSNRHS